MPEALSNDHIALLCDIAQANKAPVDRTPDVQFLIDAGYVLTVADTGKPTLQLTEKASTMLSARGATLNES
jgi:hypothetical protein